VSAPRVAVVGAGISGAACARALSGAGIEVVLLDRGRRLGGRMAARTLRQTGLPFDGRVVDVGAAYLTAAHPDFLGVVDAWVERGLAHPWTDTFTVIDTGSSRAQAIGPMRYAARGGLRSLVEDLVGDLPHVVHPHEVEQVEPVGSRWSVDGDEYDGVVLAMPAPQAADLLPPAHPVQDVLEPLRYDPVLALVAAYDERSWHPFDGIFVNDSAVLTFVADDGARRGDDAPVLVAHSSPVLAARHLDDPTRALPMLLAGLHTAVGTRVDPVWAEVRRWSLARPHASTGVLCHLEDNLGLCGDAWGRTSRIETAWLSGDGLGRRLAERLAR
jgi:predicted NAD/FAD-dependent oxidoreductase